MSILGRGTVDTFFNPQVYLALSVKRANNSWIKAPFA